jgi:hypothetical protein
MILNHRHHASKRAQLLRLRLPVAAVRTSTVEDSTAAALGLVVVSALYFDGRAHVLELPDSFFTPWHALLYAGLLVLVGWLAFVSRRAAARLRPGRIALVPAAYGPAVFGAAIFAVGGVSDMVWHSIFGVEFGIDALLSPPHLLLFCGGALLLSGPVRAFTPGSGPASTRGRLPPTLGVVGITGIAAFALSFLSAFISDSPTIALRQAPEGTAEHLIAEGAASAGLASFIVTSLVLVVPLIYLIRSGLAGPGSAVLVVTSVALWAAVLENFQGRAVVIAAFVAGGLIDVVLMAMQRAQISLQLQELVVAGALPLAVWSGGIVALEMVASVRWSPEMVTGSVLLSAMVCVAAVGVLGLVRKTPRQSQGPLLPAGPAGPEP